MQSPWGKYNNNNSSKNKNFFNNLNNFKFPNLKFPFSEKKAISLLLIIFFIFLAVWLSTGIYQVNQGEQAIIMRFGKYLRTASPGLNFHLPFPIEKKEVRMVERSQRIEIGYRSKNGQDIKNYNIKNSFFTSVPEESIMLTGDENIVDLKCDVMWHIKNLSDFIFNVSIPEAMVKAVSQSSIREVIGETPISDILSDKKQAIADKIESIIQATIDKCQIGVIIERVELLEAEPPGEVISSYRDVQTAKADKEKEINQAYAYANGILPEARGEAIEVIKKSEAYKQEMISKAQGDTKRFSAILKQYIQNKAVTGTRLYLETITKVLQNTKKVVVDSTITHLPLNSLLNN